MENFPGKTVSSCSRHKYEKWGTEQDRELYTSTGPGLPIYWWSLSSADFWINHSPCAMEMSRLSKHQVHQTLNNCCGTFRCLNQSLVKPHQEKKSHPKWSEMSQTAAREAIFQHLEVSDTAFFSCLWKDFYPQWYFVYFPPARIMQAFHCLFGCTSSASCQTSVGAEWWPRREAMPGNVKASHTRRCFLLAFPSSGFLFMEISKSHLFKGHWGSILSSWVSPSWVFVIPVVISVIPLTRVQSAQEHQVL